MSLKNILTKKNKPIKEDYWIPLSDLMTGLMMIFMLIAIINMVNLESENQNIKEAAFVYKEMKIDLYNQLKIEFSQDLLKWGAELDTDLTIRFKEPEVLFDTGKDSLKPKFIEILNDFFPRYIKILSAEKYQKAIEEIRIEGHTSSIWSVGTPNNQAYFLNMALSQARTRSVLQYVLLLPTIREQQQWLKQNLTANGLSSSKLIYHKDGTENKEGSQRVEFRVRTNADARLNEILNKVQE